MKNPATSSEDFEDVSIETWYQETIAASRKPMTKEAAEALEKKIAENKTAMEWRSWPKTHRSEGWRKQEELGQGKRLNFDRKKLHSRNSEHKYLMV